MELNLCGVHSPTLASGVVYLCWGISKYGNTVYTLKYNITNFVNQYSDSQGVYFSLMPKEMEQSQNQL